MNKEITPFMATGIGSMPFTDPAYACDMSLSSFPDAPFWPQLPRLGFQEDMVAQYVEGIPGVIVNDEDKVVRGELAEDDLDAMAAFYDAYTTVQSGAAGPIGFGEITEAASKGLHEFRRKLATLGKKHPFIKVQTTGACTLALGVRNPDGTPIYYADEYRDLVVKALAMKSRWQIRLFAPYAERIICFIDEPVLSAFGSSAYLGVKREDVVAVTAEVVDAIHADDALAAVHCCGNTEWTMFVDAGVDIINFDSYEYGDTMSLYHAEMKKYLKSGGILAWGAVPTSDAIRAETVESLEARLEEMIDLLGSKGIDRALITTNAMITPACGTGSIPAEDTERVFQLAGELSKRMMQKYGAAGAEA